MDKNRFYRNIGLRVMVIGFIRIPGFFIDGFHKSDQEDFRKSELVSILSSFRLLLPGKKGIFIFFSLQKKTKMTIISTMKRTKKLAAKLHTKGREEKIDINPIVDASRFDSSNPEETG